MKSEKVILNRIAKNKATIKMFIDDKKQEKDKITKQAYKRAIFTLQSVNRELKYILK